MSAAPQYADLAPVPIAPLPIERFREVLDDAAYRDLLALRDHATQLLRGRVVWCVNTTATGGGVAEMLRSLLAYTRGSGVDTRWLVLQAEPDFFTLTKRLHNRLHGAPGDGGPLGAAEAELYRRVTGEAGRRLAELVRPDDVVLLHDPQTLGMAPALAEAVQVVWRCHVGVDQPDDGVRAAWGFLEPYLRAVDGMVFSRERFVWSGVQPSKVVVIPPSIDVFSAKNQDLGPDATLAILRVAGLVAGDGDEAAAAFVREDGTPGRVDRRAAIVQERPLEAGDTVVAQVSRWDRLKDPVGVLQGFVAHAGECGDAHLLLVGPDVTGVADDPEGREVLDEVVAAWRELPAAARGRVHIASLPMDDPEENAAIVNAIQRHAAVVVQKSLAEGFGLTVAEALWKGRPVVASGVGGIQDQVVDEVTGLLVDPHDLAAFGHAVCRLVTDGELAARLGTAGRDAVRERFLEPRHLAQWVELIQRLDVAAGRSVPAAAPAAPAAPRPAPAGSPATPG